jgi:hypothetical protein
VSVSPYHGGGRGKGGGGSGKAERSVLVGGDRASSPVVRRDDLAPGSTFTGPLIVEEVDSTTYVAPDFGGYVDDTWCIVLSLSGAGAAAGAGTTPAEAGAADTEIDGAAGFGGERT